MSHPATLLIRKGEEVQRLGREYIITNIVGLDKVLARDMSSGELLTLDISGLKPKPNPSDTTSEVHDVELRDVPEQDWEIARSRFQAIAPFLEGRYHGNSLSMKMAQTHGVSVKTVYRWLNIFRNAGVLSALLPSTERGGKGKSRLKDEQVEAILKEGVDLYLQESHPSVAAAVEFVRERCDAAGLKPPAYGTLKARIDRTNMREITKRRFGEKVASMLHDVNEGKIPDAEWPLALVQMDHTLLPVIIVDDQHRRAIARAWITLIIDVFSRVVVGMYLSLDAPSAMSAGICVSRAILPKEAWLASLGMDEESWPVWGVPGILHMDNAREFRGNMLKDACQEYVIDLHLRPVKKPHYGAHIERLMGTFSEALKMVPGATFSGPKEKGEYDAEGNAVMTLEELERWLVLLIGKYHNGKHASLGMSPLQKYREGLLGTRGKPGRGLPARRLDEEKVSIDFMPYVDRGIHEYGVMCEGFSYFSDVLRPWVNLKDEKHKGSAREYRFRYDPRDISVLYFFEPNVRRYFAIPYRDLSQPPISLWEARAAKRMARKDGVKCDEQMAFQYVRKMREEVDRSTEKTKLARKEKQKRVEHAKARANTQARLPKAKAIPPPAPPSAIPGYHPELVTAFDDE